MHFRIFICITVVIISLTGRNLHSQPETYPYLAPGAQPLKDTIKLLDSLYSYFWRTNIGYWVNEDLDLFYYDNNTDLIKLNRKHWDESYGYFWYDDSRVLYTLKNSLRIEELKQEYELIAQKWNNYTLFTFVYDDQGKRTEWKWQRWSPDISDWVNFRLNQYLFDSADKQIQSISLTWDPESSGWLFSQKIETLYNSTGNDSIILTSYWKSSDSAWLNLSKKTSLYDLSGNLVNELMQVWDDGSEKWIPSSNSLSLYDNDHHILETVYQHWNVNQSGWENKTRTEYIYNELGLISYAVNSLWNPPDSVWENTSRNIYSYDLEGDQVDYVLQNRTQDQKWENSLRKQFVYKKVLSIPEVMTADCISCRWETISSSARSISCIGLKDNATYLFSLYSMQGSHISSQVISGNQPIRIRGEIPAGIYLMTIASKDHPVHQEKVFIP
ncbi:MAG TPA: hypothetical protein PKI34_05800 [Bacteroidales bacterium]|nr:hypothetical protein [Bacteroidales bacterium]